VDARVVDRVEIPAPELAADRLVEDRVAPDALDDHRGRDLAASEPGHPQVAPEPARRRLHGPLDLLRRDLGLEAHARFGQLGERRLHVGGHRGGR
jgi:hypothetical protein